METRTFKALEFDKILSMLSERCTTAAARERALATAPIANLSILENTLRETNDAAEIIEKLGAPPLAVTDGIEGMLSTA